MTTLSKDSEYYHDQAVNQRTYYISEIIEDWIEKYQFMPVANIIPHQFDNTDTVSMLIQNPCKKKLIMNTSKNPSQKRKKKLDSSLITNQCIHSLIVKNINNYTVSSVEFAQFKLTENCETFCITCQRVIGCGHIYVLLNYRVNKKWLSIAATLFKPILNASYSECLNCGEHLTFSIPLMVIPESTITAFRANMKAHIDDDKLLDSCRKMIQYGFKIFIEPYERAFFNNDLAVESYMAYVITLALDTFEIIPPESPLMPPRVKLIICESIFSTRTSDEAKYCFYWALLIADLLCCRWLTEHSKKTRNYLAINMNQSTVDIVREIHKRICVAPMNILDYELVEQIEQIEQTGLLHYIEQRTQIALGQCFQYIMMQNIKINVDQKSIEGNIVKANIDSVSAVDDLTDLEDETEFTNIYYQSKNNFILNEKKLKQPYYQVIGINVPGNYSKDVIRPISRYPMPATLARQPIDEIPKRSISYLYDYDGHMHTFNTGQFCDTCNVELGHETPSHVTDELIIQANHFYEFNRQFCMAGKFHRLDSSNATICLDCKRNPYLTLAEIIQKPEYYRDITLERISIDTTIAELPNENYVDSHSYKKIIPEIIPLTVHTKLMNKITNPNLQFINTIYEQKYLLNVFSSRANRVRHLLYIARSLIALFTPKDLVCEFDTNIVNTIDFLYSDEEDLTLAYWVLYRSFQRILNFDLAIELPKLERQLVTAMWQIQVQFFDDDAVANQDIAYNMIFILLNLIRSDKASSIVPYNEIYKSFNLKMEEKRHDKIETDNEIIGIIDEEEQIQSDTEVEEEAQVFENKLATDLEGIDEPN